MAGSCKDAQKLTWNKEKVRPREAVSFVVENGPANATCAHSVVDKSVTLIGNPNRVTRPKLQQLREDLFKRRILSSEINRRTSSKCSNSVYAAFKEIGLFALSDKTQGE